jgi:acetylcholinesterase
LGQTLNSPSETFETYYINFINNLDPNNGTAGSPLINWPQYAAGDPELLLISLNGNSLTPDTFRKNASNFLLDTVGQLRV